MTPDTGILTQLLNSFMSAFTSGAGFLQGDARWLLGTLIVIDLILAIVLNLSDGDHMKTLIRKTLKYGFFIWLVMDYKNLAQVILDSFKAIGLKAGGGALAESLLSDPSQIASYGIWVTEPIFDMVGSLSTIDALTNFHKIIMADIASLIIVFCFFLVGIQIFITYLEFYVVAAVAIILIPFGVNRHTAFLGEKAIGAVLGFGLKLMVLSFIAAVAIPLVKTWSLPVDPSTKQILCLLLGSLAIAFLAWHAPAMAAGLLSGHPTLTAGTGAGFGMAGVSAAIGLAWAGGAASRAISGGGQQATATLAAGGRTAGGGSTLSSGLPPRPAPALIDEEPPKGDGGPPPAPKNWQGFATAARLAHDSVPPSHEGGGGSAKPNLKGGDE